MNRSPAPILSYRALWLLAALIAITLAGYFSLLNTFTHRAQDRAPARATALAGSIESALGRLDHLPYVIAQNPTIVVAMSMGETGQMNPLLAAIAQRSGAEVIYLMNLTGQTIAASNYDQPGSFVGQYYNFRPYFRDAVAGKTGYFFAVGVTTGRPGYFVSEPIRNARGTVIGVAVVKLGLNTLTAAWADSGETVLVANADGIVLAASDPSHEFRTLAPLPADVRAQIDARRQFGSSDLTPLDWSQTTPRRAQLDGVSYVTTTAPIPREGWQLTLLTDLRGIRAQALWYVAIGLAILVAIGGGAVLFRSARLNAALQLSIRDRRRLSREIDERRRAETKLHAAQAELARTSRLAALGQLSASITHELGQPISAMRNYITAAEIAAGAVPGGLNAQLSGLVARMQSITDQLRFFATPSRRDSEVVPLTAVLSGARLVMDPDLTHAGAQVTVIAPDTPIYVRGIQHRLEQVLVNLLKNALQSAADQTPPQLTITLTGDGTTARLTVTDNGPGLADKTMLEMQEPFMTTKSSGQGMGLGLAISAQIAQDHNGDITATDTPTGGASFSITLPQVPAPT